MGQQGHGQVAKPPNGAGAIEPGGFVDLGRDGLERAEEDHHCKGGAPPDIGEDHGKHRVLAEHVNRADAH